VTHTNLDMSQAAGELAIIGVVVAVTVLLHALWQRRYSSDLLRKHNDVAGFLFSAVGVIYAVVLGFVVVVVWEKYDSTVANVDTEIAAVSDLYRTAAGFSEPARSQIRSDLSRYTAEMIEVEWPLMAHRTDVAKDLALLEGLAHRVNAYAPKTAGDSNVQQASMTQLTRLFDARRQRLIQSVPSVPLVLWFALVVGALAMLVFAFLFGVENRRAQLVMTAILAGLIAVLFIVISEFDEPFNGSVSISDDGWVLLQQHLPNVP
jgi:multisubunit Na+/H+ antiporter MnhB subunit